jgi:SAM-dependent methyltransferase
VPVHRLQLGDAGAVILDDPTAAAIDVVAAKNLQNDILGAYPVGKPASTVCPRSPACEAETAAPSVPLRFQVRRRRSRACRYANTKLVGVDLSEKAVLRAASRLSGRASVCRAAAKSLPFRTGSFTHVTAFGILEHIIDAQAAIAEIMRVVQPGGHIYITTSNCRSLLQIINMGRQSLDQYPYGFQRNWTWNELSALALLEFLLPHAKISVVYATQMGDTELTLASPSGRSQSAATRSFQCLLSGGDHRP